MRLEEVSDGWFYRQAGQIRGPVTVETLRELLGAGRLSPHQAVWQQGALSLFFVRAATAAFVPHNETGGSAR